jgi:ABC-type phosphate/phosphonate transport system ATPase subunit
MKRFLTSEVTFLKHNNNLFRNKLFNSIALSTPVNLLRMVVLIGLTIVGLLTLLQVNHTPNKQITFNTSEIKSSAKSKVSETRYNLPMMFEANYGTNHFLWDSNSWGISSSVN